MLQTKPQEKTDVIKMLLKENLNYRVKYMIVNNFDQVVPDSDSGINLKPQKRS